MQSTNTFNSEVIVNYSLEDLVKKLFWKTADWFKWNVNEILNLDLSKIHKNKRQAWFLSLIQRNQEIFSRKRI